MLLMVFCLLSGSADAQTVSGSWVAQVPAVRVAVPGRDTLSQPLSPPPHVAREATIVRVTWRYQLPVGSPVQVLLCHPQRCIPLSSAAGSSHDLAGLPAAAPLHFRFHLASGASQRIGGLQAIVDYRLR